MREEPTLDELIQVVVEESQNMTPEEREYVAQLKALYTAEILEIYESVQRELREAEHDDESPPTPTG